MKTWHEKLKGRPGVSAGLNVPEKNRYKDVKDPKEQGRIAEEASAWVLKGMEEDKKKAI